MYLKTESSYISGLLNMASSCSKTIGLSYADAECFNKDKYKQDFSKLHKIKEIDLSLEKLNITFKELLKKPPARATKTITKKLCMKATVPQVSP